jgi:hypothetical protein
MSLRQNVGRNHTLLNEDKPSENVAKFRYLGTASTNQNCIHRQINSRLSSGNALCHSVQSSHLHSKNLNIKIYETNNLPVVLYGF